MILLEMACEIGLNPIKVSNTHGGEWHSPCPSCAGRDRFILQPNKPQKNCTGYYFCRQCSMHGDTIQFGRDFKGLSFQEAAQRAKASINNQANIMNAILPKTKEVILSSIAKPSRQWMQAARSFVETSHNHLLQESATLAYLEKRGIPLDAVKKYVIGLNPKDLNMNGATWGLKTETLWLPQGIVIPTIANNDIVRIKIRRSECKKDDNKRYILITGSMKGLNIIGNVHSDTSIVVESELDMYALDHMLGSLSCIIAVGGSIKNPDHATNYRAEKSKNLLICHDNDDAGIEMWGKWKGLYPHAKACPTLSFAKDIGEAIEQGFDIKDWLLKVISEQDKEQKIIQQAATTDNNKAIESSLPSPEQKKLCVEQMFAKLNKKQNSHTNTTNKRDHDDQGNTEKPITKAEHKKDEPTKAIELPKEKNDAYIKEYELLTSWYRTNRHRLPQQGFKLLWTTKNGIPTSLLIPDPSLWYTMLDYEIKQGHDFERARSGCLQNDIVQLKKFVDPLSFKKEK